MAGLVADVEVHIQIALCHTTLQATPGGDTTRSLAAIDCNSLGVHTVISIIAVSFSHNDSAAAGLLQALLRRRWQPEVWGDDSAGSGTSDPSSPRGGGGARSHGRFRNRGTESLVIRV